jgi:hypothetical protein
MRTSAKRPSVMTAFEVEVTTRIQLGNFARASRYPFARREISPAFVASVKKS